jgi:ubiquinone/menaquinone biosynthesis C-methylase UbiE
VGIEELFCDPKTHEPLKADKESLLTETASYPLVGGIYVFLKEGDVVGSNQKFQELYDKIGVFTGSIYWFLCHLFRLDMVSKRKELLSDLHIKPGDTVLETSIGAGANIPALELQAEYVGVDISMGMLRACQKYSLVKPYRLTLIQANAEYLPFKDNAFDVVLHFGGINFFNDKAQAIREMVRVAKPGAQILIGDETQGHVEKWYQKIPFVSRYFKNTPKVAIPIELIPKSVIDLKISYKWNGSMYIISFFKP